MIAKVIAHGKNRNEAIIKLDSALSEILVKSIMKSILNIII